MNFCLSQFTASLVARRPGPTPIALMAVVQAVDAFNRSPCYCENCGRLQLEIAQLVAPGFVYPGDPDLGGVPGDQAG